MGGMEVDGVELGRDDSLTPDACSEVGFTGGVFPVFFVLGWSLLFTFQYS